jgi:SAM-dependent methyltransferase
MSLYDEAEDMRQHLDDITSMDTRMQAAGVQVNWHAATVLDLGASGGLHAGVLASRAKRVIAADMEDQHVRWSGEFVRLLSEKFARHGMSLPMARIEFNVADAHQLMYRDNWFDIVVSFNSFEHIHDPEGALREIGRVLKHGGIFYASFDPIWTADTGSHFTHRVPAPWAHLLLSEADFITQMNSGGAPPSEIEEFKKAMNRWRLPRFKLLFESKALDMGLNLVWMTSWKGQTEGDILRG